VAQRLGVIGLQLDGLAVTVHRLVQFALIAIDLAQIAVEFGDVRFLPDGLKDQILRLPEPLALESDQPQTMKSVHLSGDALEDQPV
jgi:hypothetical protein